MLTFFHGSDTDFDSFSDKFLVREGSGPNSALGIWLGERWVAQGFGRFTYTVAASFENPYYMDIRQMVGHHNESDGDPTYFVNMRADFRRRGHDAIFVRECDGTTPTVVALDVAKLKILEKEVAQNSGAR